MCAFVALYGIRSVDASSSVVEEEKNGGVRLCGETLEEPSLEGLVLWSFMKELQMNL